MSHLDQDLSGVLGRNITGSGARCDEEVILTSGIRMRTDSLRSGSCRGSAASKFRPFTGRCTAPRPATLATAEPSIQASSHSDGPRFKANIDFKFIKENLDLVVKNAEDRNSNADPRLVVQLYDKYVQLKMEADEIRAERNENSNAMKVNACWPLTCPDYSLRDSENITILS